jgi:hypothetical protein
MSHLRFGPQSLHDSTYQITHADYVAIHNPSYARPAPPRAACIV